MLQRGLLKRVATLAAGVLLLAQLALAAYACPPAARAGSGGDQAAAAAAAMPGCNEPMGATDPDAPHLCAAHCKQGAQSERAQPAVSVPPALLTALYAAPALPEPAPAAPRAWARLNALVAASPPHTIAHCVLRI